MFVCIIIPCYNEANRLPADAFVAYARQHPTVRFCFVDDGSTDNTRARLEQLQTTYPDCMEALILPRNLGKAGAVRAGMLHGLRTGPADYLGFLDADLATPLDAIGDLITVLSAQPGLDLVMGSRIKHLGTDIRRKAFRHYTGRIIATFISNILQLPVYDSQCGAKLFQRGVVAALFAEPFISPWLFDVEVLARLIRLRGRPDVLNRVVEWPLRRWIEQSDSRIRPSYMLRVWYELFRIYRTYR